MTATDLAHLLGGFVLLLGGAELLVRGASRLARAMGISPLVVGLTVVAFGTSAPEIAVSVGAVLNGTGDLAFGNVLGSNIANVLLVLGLSASLAPLAVDRALVRREVPLMILASALVALMALDGAVGRGDAVVLLALLAGWTWWTVASSRAAVRAEKEKAEASGAPAAAEPPRSARSVAWNVFVAAAGFGMLVLGSDFLVAGAVAVAKALGVDELVIGLTVVAVGTSLPEIATSAMATVRGERDIAVGNVVGSNLFNLLAVLGAAGAVGPSGVPVHPRALAFDVPVMLATAVACLPVFYAGSRITRREGLFFLSGYGAYVAWLVLAARGSPWLDPFRDAMVFFVLPLSGFALGWIGWREWRLRRGGDDGGDDVRSSRSPAEHRP